MKCPTDGTTLTMSERSGIEIDYCPECRGVWLDRGELDKIIERSASQPQQPAATTAPPAPSYEQTPSYEQERDARRVQQERRLAEPHQQQPYPKKKKKESWLSEIFD